MMSLHRKRLPTVTHKPEETDSPNRELLTCMVWLVIGCQVFSRSMAIASPVSPTSSTVVVGRINQGREEDLRGTLRNKRSPDVEEILEELALKVKREPAKMRFNSWGGKRTKLSQWEGRRDGAKRKFNSWGGKRSDDGAWSLYDYDPPFSEDKRADSNAWASKRAKFNSWGGKRFENGGEEKRAKFNSWGGKRSDSGDYGEESGENFLGGAGGAWSLEEAKRSKFNSWGGKRDSFDEPLLWDTDDKRAKFNSWGGKRAHNDTLNSEAGDFQMVKRAYSPSTSLKRKQIFSSWGGKRMARSASNGFRLRTSGKDRSWQALLRPIRRGPDFYAWGGKRSETPV